MLKYKSDFKVIRQTDSSGNRTENSDDTYIPCKAKAQIYRYNADTLAITFHTKQYANNRIVELSEQGIHTTLLQCGDNERTYLFSETDFIQVADIVKAKRKVKRELTDEQREELRQRMLKARENLNSIKNDKD